MRNMRLMGKLTAIAILAVWVSACGSADPAKTPGSTSQTTREQGKSDWTQWPALDPTLSCAGQCGYLTFDPSAWTYCGCDDGCQAANDCCADAQQHCAAPPTSCDYSDPAREWSITDWPKCFAARIGCEPGKRPFQEPGCGCGCELEPQPTCDYADPSRDWVIKDWPKCLAARIGCDAGQRPFQVPGCGCGCEPDPQASCDYSAAQRKYFAQQPGGCAAMLIACDPGWDLFDDACGCGCADQVPDCIRALIAQLASEPLASPPASITLYEYKGQRVYFQPQRCCDIPSAVYDAQCNVICAPDGGFSGAGDGRCPDFFQSATSLGQIWADPR